jgi:hypothetical protein
MFYDPEIHLLDVGYLPFFKDSDQIYWPSPLDSFEEIPEQQQQQHCSWWRFWCW